MNFRWGARGFGDGPALRPNDAQAWLTSATVLRVLGDYEQALAACEEIAEPVVVQLCTAGCARVERRAFVRLRGYSTD